MAEWQPIETAPKDGSYVDLWCVKEGEGGCRVPDACWWDGFWRDARGEPVEDEGWKNTHWMPLPGPPSVLPLPEGGEKDEP